MTGGPRDWLPVEIAELRADPEPREVAVDLADLLVEVGRVDETVVVVRDDPIPLAKLLIRQGRVGEALRPFLERAAARQADKAAADENFWRGFRRAGG